MSYCSRKNSANREPMIRSLYDQNYNKVFNPINPLPIEESIQIIRCQCGNQMCKGECKNNTYYVNPKNVEKKYQTFYNKV
jgi:hypothetical protein